MVEVVTLPSFRLKGIKTELHTIVLYNYAIGHNGEKLIANVNWAIVRGDAWNLTISLKKQMATTMTTMTRILLTFQRYLDFIIKLKYN